MGEEKILKTIRYCANDYMKQEDGIQCFEWGDLWVLNEYIKKLQQENEDLKEKVILLRASEPMLELEKYYGERDLYKEVIEEVRERVVELKKRFKQEEHQGTAYDDDLEYDELLQILDKVRENK